MKLAHAYASSSVALSAIAVTLPWSALAADQGTSIEEVIVTAQKREQRLSEVPLAIQALQGDRLEQTGIRELNQVITSIPGASEGRSLSAGSRSYQIRGVASYYGDATIGYYLDDAVFTVLNRNFAPVASAFDVERVEVLRGPQGTLYGSGAMGGTIRFITADPDLHEVKAHGNAGYSATDEDGEDNYYGNFAASVPLIEDKLAIRGAASYDFQGGYATSTTFPNDANETKAENYRLKVLAKPSDESTIKLTYQHNKITDQFGRQMMSGDPGAYYPSTLLGVPIHPDADSEYDMFGAYLSYDFGRVLVESSTGYLDRKSFGLVPINVGLPGEIPMLSTGADSDTLSSELRLVSHADGPWNWIVGGIYQDAKSREDVLLRLGGPRPVPPPGLPPGVVLKLRDEDSTYKSESYAVYGEVSYELFDGKLIPLVGVRYFEDDRTFTTLSRRAPPAPPPPAPQPPAQVTTFDAGDTFDSVNPRFNLSYLPRDGVLFYLNIASGFRSGTFNTQAGVLAAPPGSVGVTVDPDELTSYELGTKLTFGSVAVELAAYYIDWTDVQMNFTGAQNVQYIANAGDVVGTGIDYGLNWLITDGLQLQLSGNFNSTELDTLHPGFPEFGNVREGEQLSSVPEQTHRVALNYQRPVGSSGLQLVLFGSYSYTDKQGDPSDAFPTPASRGRFGGTQELASARIGIEGHGWGVRLVGDNLLGEKDPIQIAGSGLSRVYPMTYGVELSFDF